MSGPVLNRCPYCHRPADAVSEVEGGDKPPAGGDVSICFGCGRLALFTGRGYELRRPSDDERAELLRDDDVVAAVMAWRAVVDGG